MNTFTLKVIALILMTLDHIGLYFPNLPFAFILRCLGRGAYPLFLFCMAWGYHYTKYRGRYLLRLYLMNLFMTILGLFIHTRLPAQIAFANHNIFLPLFFIGLFISILELVQTQRKKGFLLLGAVVLVQLLYYLIPAVFPSLRALSGDTLTGFIPNLALNEYGFEFIALGVAIYFVKEKKELLCVVYTLFCVYQLHTELLYYNFATQWLMIIALPLMLCYNQKKGPGMKYFFYFYYPAHAFLLFYLANFVFAG